MASQDAPTRFDIAFTSRDFCSPAAPPGLAWTVERLSWQALGGPERALLRARSAEAARLLDLPRLLRCGVLVKDDLGPAWWGYVSAVELHAGRQVLRCDLDAMANRVAVKYTPLGPLVGQKPVHTPFVTDADSLRLYGEKEKVVALGGACAAADALAYAGAVLREIGRPVTSTRIEAGEPGGAVAGSYAVVEARGWWQTLDWKFYGQPLGLGGVEKTGPDLPVGTPACQKLFFQLPDPGGLLSEIWLRARCFRAADQLVLDLYASDPRASSPVPTPAASISIPAAALSDGHQWTRFQLPAPLAYPGGRWWPVLRRSGPLSDLDYFGVQVDEGGWDPSSVVRVYNGADWLARLPDADMIYQAVGLEESTAQLARILCAGAAGQFLREVWVEQPSGIPIPLYRAGSQRGRAEAERILALGTSGGRRLLVQVAPDRRARVYPAPLPAEARVQAGRDGILRGRTGRPLLPSQSPHAQWIRLPDLGGTVWAEGTEWAGALAVLRQA